MTITTANPFPLYAYKYVSFNIRTIAADSEFTLSLIGTDNATLCSQVPFANLCRIFILIDMFLQVSTAGFVWDLVVYDVSSLLQFSLSFSMSSLFFFCLFFITH